MQIMLTDCVQYYVELMQTLINEATSYFSQSELVTAHQNTKSAAIEQVRILIKKKRISFQLLIFLNSSSQNQNLAVTNLRPLSKEKLKLKLRKNLLLSTKQMKRNIQILW